MSYNAADGAALVAAAVQAAIRERAPRRTVAAVAAAVAGTVLSANAKPLPAAAEHKKRTMDAQDLSEDAGDPVKLLETLRAVRRAKRAAKKQKRREAKQAAQGLPSSENQRDAVPSHDASAAGQSAEFVGTSAAAPAPVLESSPAVASPRQPRPKVSIISDTLGDTASELSCHAGLLRGIR